MTIKATTENVAGLTATKLTGAFPVLDASAVTGVSTGPQTGASDPTISTNPTAVGRVYQNTTSGEIFICTSATAGENVWVNVGAGTGDVGKPFGGLGGGTTSGYSAGGDAPVQDTIEKYSFASSIVVADHGNLTTPRDATGGCSSATDGYTIGGYISGPPGGVGGFRENIDRFSFASNAGATDHGDLTRDTGGPAGCSSSTNGYAVGGHRGPSNAQSNIIDTFTFGSNSNATDHGDMSMAGKGRAGSQSSNTHGYVSGGETPGPVVRVNIIDKFAFVSNVTGTDHGDLTASRHYPAGCSSTTHGFTAGGQGNSGLTNIIDKFTFNSNSNATDHGDLTAIVSGCNGASSTTHGYVVAGYRNSPAARVAAIDKFSFVSNVTASDHGDLAASESTASGYQV